ncbi:aldo-keto reductase family 1 member C1-like isoform X4 [Eretmochelys imbricata]
MELCKDTSVKMNDGHGIPVVGFGTYAPDTVPKSKCEEAVKVAIEVGYRHIDGAYFYENEEEVGRAIREKIADGTVKREDIFYTGKLWSTFNAPEMVQSALKKSLKSLQFDYIDLYIIHTPLSLKPGDDLCPVDGNGKLIFDNVDLCATWEVECHPYLNQRKLLEFCKSKNIVLVAFSALGSHREERWVDQSTPLLLEDPVLNALAKKYSRSPALVALRYQLQRGVVVLAKSFTRKRIEDNFKVFDFQLTEEDMKAIDSLNQNLRYDLCQQ